MKTKTYFKNREKLYKTILNVSNKEMAELYRKSAKRIIKDLELLYLKIMSEQDPLKSHLYLYQEYYDTLMNLNKELLKLGAKQEVILDKRLLQMYEDNSKLVNNTFGLLGKVDADAAKRAVRTVWCLDGKSFSDRIWKDKALLESTIEENLVACVSTGMPKDRFVEELMNRFNVSFHNALRLVRTELSYIQNKSAIDRYRDAGCEYYEILEPIDERTCEHCKEMNGKRYRIADAQPGFNMSPFHPQCRGSVLPVIE